MDGDRIWVLLSNPAGVTKSDEVSLSVRFSDLAVTLIVVFLGSAVVAAVIATVIIVRRKIHQRRNISFNQATYGVDDVLYPLLKPWTPPEDSKLCRNTETLPISFSKTTLEFGRAMRIDVNEEYTDTVEFKWQGGFKSMAIPTLQQSGLHGKRAGLDIPLLSMSKEKKGFDIIFHLPESPKCSLTAEPNEVSLDYRRKSNIPSFFDASLSEDKVQFKLKMNITTSITALIGVEMPQLRKHFYICCNIVASPSVWIDIDEIETEPSPIGEGGFGVVYKGHYKGETVAVKMLKMQDWVDKKTLEEFELEIYLLSILKNPGIVSFIGASKLRGKLALVTEFMPNGSLEKLMAKKIPYATKLRIALEIAKAIDYLHKNNVLHRDIKADNVLIESMDVNSPNMIRLSDFGSARVMAEDKIETFTKNVGTPIYMAPEILQKKRYNKEADIYSYGVLLWVIITQKEPYTAFNHVWDVTKYVIDGNREAIPAGCPADFADLITGCWHPDPEKRLSVRTIIDRLENMYEKQFKM